MGCLPNSLRTPVNLNQLREILSWKTVAGFIALYEWHLSQTNGIKWRAYELAEKEYEAYYLERKYLDLEVFQCRLAQYYAKQTTLV